jgi:hypothetical protein
LGKRFGKWTFTKLERFKKKGEGGCGSAVCIGLECLCKVLDLKGKVVYNFCVSFVNFGEVGLDKLE